MLGLLDDCDSPFCMSGDICWLEDSWEDTSKLEDILISPEIKLLPVLLPGILL